VRQEQTDRTRQRILDAAAELFGSARPADLTIPVVAERAGVSLRTVYRYFPTKEALLDCVVAAGSERTRAAFAPGTVHLDDLAAIVPQLWAELMERPGFARAQHLTPAGWELRRIRSQDRRAEIAAILRAAGIKLDRPDEARLCALLSALLSSAMMLDLTDLAELEVDEAARTAAFAMKAVIGAAKRKREVGR
jgi:AcrR family transcriptional regulator